MKKYLLLLICCIFLSGCWSYGDGSTVGYVTTVESGIFWDSVWFRVETGTMSSMQSKPESYAISKDNSQLKEELMTTCKNHQKIELKYRKHIFLAHIGQKDVIVGFAVIP